jgi:hypothetical protein
MGWHQPNLMPDSPKFTRPMMGCGAGFQANHASRQICNEGQHLGTAYFSAQDNATVRPYAVELEDVFGEIYTDRGNLHGGGLLMWGVRRLPHPGMLMPIRGHPPHRPHEQCSQPRWRSARPGPHKSLGIKRRFLNQADRTPVDR